MSEIVIQMAIKQTFTLGFPTFRGHHFFTKDIFVYIWFIKRPTVPYPNWHVSHFPSVSENRASSVSTYILNIDHLSLERSLGP